MGCALQSFLFIFSCANLLLHASQRDAKHDVARQAVYHFVKNSELAPLLRDICRFPHVLDNLIFEYMHPYFNHITNKKNLDQEFIYSLTLLNHNQFVSISGFQNNQHITTWQSPYCKLLRFFTPQTPSHATAITKLSANRILTYARQFKDHLRLYDTAHGLIKMIGPKETINALIVLSPECIALCKRDKSIVHIWTLFLKRSTSRWLKNWENDYCEVRQLKGHTKEIRTLALLSSDRMVSGSKDKTVKIWNTIAGTCVKTLCGHEATIRDCVVVSDKQIASLDQKRCIKIWNIEKEVCLHTLREDNSQSFLTTAVYRLQFFAGKYLIALYPPHTIAVWDTETATRIPNTIALNSEPSDMIITPDNLVISTYTSLHVWQPT
jgi:WD40 repeat protein